MRCPNRSWIETTHDVAPRGQETVTAGAGVLVLADGLPRVKEALTAVVLPATLAAVSRQANVWPRSLLAV